MDFRLINRLLSKLAIGFTLALIIPIIAAILLDKDHVWIFVVSFLICGCISILLNSYAPLHVRKRLRVREALAVVGCGWLLVCAMGALPYLLYNPYDPLAAIFESIASLTTTGVTTALAYNEFAPSILLWRCLCHWIGGVGVIMLFIVVMPQMNSGTSYMFNAELPSVVADRTLPKIKESAMLIWGIYTILTAVEIILLMLCGVPLFQSINLTLATMSTGGFSYYHESLISFPSIYVELIAVMFMLISSMNFSLYYKIWRGDWQAFRDDMEHRYYLVILAIAAILITADLYFNSSFDFIESLHNGIFQSISMGSTTGFAFHDYNYWPDFSRFVLIILIFIGGCSGSTAGGLKISRIVILLKVVWAELLKTLHPRMVYSIKMGDRVISPMVVGNITRFFFLYMLVVAVLSILISLSGLSMMDSIYIIAACMSSVGTSFGTIGPTATYHDLSNWARFVSMCAMLLGRLEIFTLLALLQPDFWRDKQNW